MQAFVSPLSRAIFILLPQQQDMQEIVRLPEDMKRGSARAISPAERGAIRPRCQG